MAKTIDISVTAPFDEQLKKCDAHNSQRDGYIDDKIRAECERLGKNLSVRVGQQRGFTKPYGRRIISYGDTPFWKR